MTSFNNLSTSSYLNGKKWTFTELIIITANNCGACKMFYQYSYDALKKKLNGLVNITEIKYETTTGRSPVGVPADIENRYRRWYPMFILLTPGEKMAIYSGKSVNGRVLGGKFDVSGELRSDNQGYQPKPDSIYKWIEDINNLGGKIESAERVTEKKESNLVPVIKDVFIPTTKAKEIGAICSLNLISSKKY